MATLEFLAQIFCFKKERKRDATLTELTFKVVQIMFKSIELNTTCAENINKHLVLISPTLLDGIFVRFRAVKPYLLFTNHIKFVQMVSKF